jgi:hypothetical protein
MRPLEHCKQDIVRSKDIFQQWPGMSVIFFVLPGNAFLPEIVEFAALHVVPKTSCEGEVRVKKRVRIIGNDAALSFYSCEMVMHGGTRCVSGWTDRLQRCCRSLQILLPAH